MWRHIAAQSKTRIGTTEAYSFTGIGSFTMPGDDSPGARDLQLYWNPNQSCVQTENWTWVDCLEVQKANHSASNTLRIFYLELSKQSQHTSTYSYDSLGAQASICNIFINLFRDPVQRVSKHFVHSANFVKDCELCKQTNTCKNSWETLWDKSVFCQSSNSELYQNQIHNYCTSNKLSIWYIGHPTKLRNRIVLCGNKWQSLSILLWSLSFILRLVPQNMALFWLPEVL